MRRALGQVSRAESLHVRASGWLQDWFARLNARPGDLSDVSVAVFALAPLIVGIYTSDADVAALATFSVRWSAASLVFYTSVSLLLHYTQGVGETKIANTVSIFERFVIPVLVAFVLGSLSEV